ncbi:MAG: ABC transporter permease [Candidatus Doudnabacteria bacterium]
MQMDFSLDDELRGIYTLWLREMKRYFRESTRLASAVITPVLWLVIFGSGLGSAFSGGAYAGATGAGGFNYQHYIFAGIIGQTLLFTAMFQGVGIIFDRQFGFLKEILVAPISRLSIFIGKVLGTGTDSMIQGMIVLVLGVIIGIPLTPWSVFTAVLIMAAITVGLICIGLTLASYMNSFEAFGTIQTFVNLPMFFLSGALFPIATLPSWLSWVVKFNPLTYGVDAIRTVTLGTTPNTVQPLGVDLLIICVFDVAMIAIGTYAFSRRQ